MLFSQLCLLRPQMIYQKQQRANRVGTIAMDELDDEGKMQRHDIEIGLGIEMRKAEILEDAADQNCSIIVCHQRYLHWKSKCQNHGKVST